MKQTETSPDHRIKLRGWLIVFGIALAFVMYGLFAYFVIGPGETPDWDFGEVEDTPGQSVYSTYPYQGQTSQPEPQHVNQKPPGILTDISDNPPPPGAMIPGNRPLTGAAPQAGHKGLPPQEGSK